MREVCSNVFLVLVLALYRCLQHQFTVGIGSSLFHLEGNKLDEREMHTGTSGCFNQSLINKQKNKQVKVLLFVKKTLAETSTCTCVPSVSSSPKVIFFFFASISWLGRNHDNFNFYFQFSQCSLLIKWPKKNIRLFLI